jgi:hypothetical protein
VRPEAVRTRSELVQAFEYLALLCLGLAARSANHRDIADRLGADAPERDEAARRLAGLYEHARYAPDDEPLGDDELSTARHDLCYLAGVSPA